MTTNPATRVFTYIETQESTELKFHFEYYNSKTVLVVDDDFETIDSFSFSEQPTMDQVIKACEEYVRST